MPQIEIDEPNSVKDLISSTQNQLNQLANRMAHKRTLSGNLKSMNVTKSASQSMQVTKSASQSMFINKSASSKHLSINSLKKSPSKTQFLQQ